MFIRYSLRATVFAITLYVGHSAAGQDSTLSTTPLSTLPLVSNERLGTGVPSRLPKVDVQRPVFTIQSGGPVAMPIPQFRPIRETPPATTPASDVKSNQPITEQSRPGQKPESENSKSFARPAQTAAQTRSTAPLTVPPRVRPTTPATGAPLMHLTAELPTADRKAIPAKPVVSPTPLPRSATTPLPAKDAPARVLNFSIN